MFTQLFWKRVGFEFARTFVPTFVLGILPVWDSIVAGDWTTANAAALAVIAAAVAAGVRAAQAMFTTIETDPRLK